MTPTVVDARVVRTSGQDLAQPGGGQGRLPGVATSVREARVVAPEHSASGRPPANRARHGLRPPDPTPRRRPPGRGRPARERVVRRHVGVDRGHVAQERVGAAAVVVRDRAELSRVWRRLVEVVVGERSGGMTSATNFAIAAPHRHGRRCRGCPGTQRARRRRPRWCPPGAVRARLLVVRRRGGRRAGQQADSATAGPEGVDRADPERHDHPVRSSACCSAVRGESPAGLRPAPRGSRVTTGRSVISAASAENAAAAMGLAKASRAGRSALAVARSPWTS